MSNPLCFNTDTDRVCLAVTPLGTEDVLSSQLSFQDVRNTASNVAGQVGGFVRQNAPAIAAGALGLLATGLAAGGAALANRQQQQQAANVAAANRILSDFGTAYDPFADVISTQASPFAQQAPELAQVSTVQATGAVRPVVCRRQHPVVVRNVHRYQKHRY